MTRLPMVGLAARPADIEDALLVHDSEEVLDPETETETETDPDEDREYTDHESLGPAHSGDIAGGWTAFAALLKWERSTDFRRSLREVFDRSRPREGTR